MGLPIDPYTTGGLAKIAGAYLLLVNLAAFLSFGADKRRAKYGQWRIPEETLFLLALLGGSVGAITGMRVFHHKTKHWQFRLGLPTIFFAQLTLVWLAASR